MHVVVTLPAYADFVEEVAALDIVSAARFNTVLPVAEPLPEFLDAYRRRLGGKPLWVDLKCRQLRIVGSAYLPYTRLEINHRIRVKTPVDATFCGGEFTAVVRAVEDGNRLIVDEVSPVPLGAGMSLAIADPSLEIEGYLTERDRAYVAAAREVDIHDYLLSYVEVESDLDELLALDPEARIVAKIESRKGLRFLEDVHPRRADGVRLMAARGDLFHELDRPHRILDATRRIVRADPRAIGASRLLSSMKRSRVPASAELGDLGFLLELGYRTLMLGDELCFDRKALMGALGVLQAVKADYR